MSGRRACVVEDEGPIRELLRLHLGLAGFVVDEIADGTLALERARATPFDLMLLDVMLPGLDGVTLCRAIRDGGANVDTPILMVTARDAEADKVLGLESGADDYVTKPFSTVELKARVRAQLRRASAQHAGRLDAVLTIGDLQIDLASRVVKRSGEEVHLTPTEWSLLRYFVSHAGQTLTHSQLFNAVWGAAAGDAQQYLRVYVGQLRRKLESDPVRPKLIRTETAVGYRFDYQR